MHVIFHPINLKHHIGVLETQPEEMYGRGNVGRKAAIIIRKELKREGFFPFILEKQSIH